MKYFAVFATCLFSLCSCVSIGIGPSKPIPSKDITFQAPPSSFKEMKADQVDRVWRNTKNGNTISYFSDCSDKSDPTLESLQTGVLQGVEDLRFEKQESINFNDRAALHSVVDGKLDGVATKVEFLIFKKNSCIFILNYVGVKARFGENEKDFSQFTKGFKVK